MALKYTQGTQSWTHFFKLISLDEMNLRENLQAGGFGQKTWLDAERRWACASLEA
jgi:hypothetical protein